MTQFSVVPLRDVPAETLDELYEQAPCGYLTTQPSGLILRVNGTFLAWIGRTREEVLGRKLQQLLTPGARILYETQCVRLLQDEGVVRRLAMDFSRADGSKMPTLMDWRPVHDASGALVGLRISVVDTTDRRLYERELIAQRERAHAAAAALRELNETLERRVEERTRQLRDTTDFARLALSAVGGVGVWTYEVATDRFFCDDSIAALYALAPGRASEGYLRSEFLHNVHPEDRAAHAQAMSGGMVDEGDLELEYRICHPDGSVRWVLSRGHTYVQEGKAVRRTGVGVDMTKQRVLEEQFRQAQKMEAVGQLTGGLAHDFNNLLTGICGSLEMMHKRMAQGRFDSVESYIDLANGAAKRAASLTQRLLAFSRRQTLDPKTIDVGELVLGMEEFLRHAIGPAVQLHVVKPSNLCSALVDPSQLENALLNLCINARDAMPGGGALRIETSDAWMDEERARDLDLSPGRYVMLRVLDTGVGMEPEVMSRAFDPFFTTKPLGQGTGLGLSMIYGFVRQSGGQVKIVSEPGRGAAVTIYLPRTQRDVEVKASDPIADQAAAGGGEVVLVVDDEATIRRLITEVLDEFGYASIEASDGPASLEILQSTAKVDLLITDVGLPGGMNGRQIADAARVLRPGLKVLFITGYAANAVVGDGQLETGMEVLTKPFAMDVLATRIRAMIEP